MVLVDTSVWIEYFKGNPAALPLNGLIDSNSLCTNDLILAELLPSIHHKKEKALKEILLVMAKIPLKIKWGDIIQMQTKNLQHGLNKVGIPDLLIVQNVLANDLQLYSFDKHFSMMSRLHGFQLMK